MSRKRIAVFILIYVMVMVSSVWASYTDGVSQKFSRGVGNIVYSTLEVPLQVTNEMNSEDYIYAFPKGAFKGAIYTVGRVVVGAYEAATFFIPQDPIIPNFNEG